MLNCIEVSLLACRWANDGLDGFEKCSDFKSFNHLKHTRSPSGHVRVGFTLVRLKKLYQSLLVLNMQHSGAKSITFVQYFSL